ncbi:protein C19orf12 homolog [Budorcas taxicolor]|uniref:protein C19orf12 homolog n=1 Tax=Budorcas taxicolor TaxID=37181 RepID=UPI0022848847|nr:protein C19orf12 homolog [Budorcas taxicolor]
MHGGEASRHWLHSSIAVEDFIKLLCSVSDKRQMKEAKKYTWSVILVILACTFLGGMLGSPPGILLRGIIGSQLIKGRERKKLFNKATAILRNLYWTDVKQLTMLVVLSEALQKQLVDMLNNYFSKELGLEVKQDK